MLFDLVRSLMRRCSEMALKIHQLNCCQGLRGLYLHVVHENLILACKSQSQINPNQRLFGEQASRMHAFPPPLSKGCGGTYSVAYQYAKYGMAEEG